MTSQHLLSARDVAFRTSLSVRQVRGLIATKQIRHVQVGGRYFVPESAIDEFFRHHMVEPLHSDRRLSVGAGGDAK